MGRQRCVVALLLLAAGGCGGRNLAAPSPAPQQPSPNNTLSGTVRDYAGAPVAGAAMSLSPRDFGAVPRSTSTDAAGHYVFSGVAGNVAVQADAPGFYNDVRWLSVYRDATQDLELTPPLAALTAGESESADLHAGPHSSVCADFETFIAHTQGDTCRVVGVRVGQPGTLKASLDWPNPTGLALTQRVSGIPGFPGFGPTPSACCAPGTILTVQVAAAGTVTLVIRLRDTSIAPVRFTLHTSAYPSVLLGRTLEPR